MKPRPIVATTMEMSLPFSARGSNTIASSLAYQNTSSRIVFANISEEMFMRSFQSFMQNSENVSTFFSTMGNLGEVKFILSGNSVVEFKRVGINRVNVISINNSRAGFLEFYSKDLAVPDFTPYCNIPNCLEYNTGIKQIGFCDSSSFFDENSLFEIKGSSYPLTTKSSLIERRII